MMQRIHNLPVALIAFAAILLMAAPALGEEPDAGEHLAQWERLEYQRVSLMGELENLEGEHQNFVETIENLKAQHARGEVSRRKLEDKLRQNLRIVRALEQLQGQLRDVDAEQASLRGEILDHFDDRRRQLEEDLRQAPSDERAELVVKLNELQDERAKYTVPLPEADQRRVERALADARQISDDHPRAMLSAADELDDTSDQLQSRLAGIQRRIDQLEQARALHRQSQQFGAFDRFFDEGERGRTIARYEQTVQSEESTDPSSPSSNSGTDEEAYAPSENGVDTVAEAEPGADPESEDDFVPVDSPPDEFGGGEHQDSTERSEEPETETVVIESEPTDDGTSYFSDRGMERDLIRLQQERDQLEEQAEELRQKADELRRKAEESY